MPSWGSIFDFAVLGVSLAANLITLTETAMRLFGRGNNRLQDLEAGVARMEDAFREVSDELEDLERDVRELREVVNDLQTRLGERLPSPPPSPPRRRNPHPHLD
ncbi:hypothetical protein NW752_001530 [Fusarium irregulare]|uniref:Uncharacterized protein n=1 Tax=Fusarium irregulare TaxID=2494466 RepID=A0A9W8PUQ5_9HYPO|nr:hypothetical protein NW766_003691 [Fusarium irregulare]KAJ4026580.1 hypothetical protein NW752_001530 [Fusarium irregulare]